MIMRNYRLAVNVNANANESSSFGRIMKKRRRKLMRVRKLHIGLCYVVVWYLMINIIISVPSPSTSGGAGGLRIDDIMPIFDSGSGSVNNNSISTEARSVDETPSSSGKNQNQNQNQHKFAYENTDADADDDTEEDDHGEFDSYSAESDLDDIFTSRFPEEIARRREIYLHSFPVDGHNSITTLKGLEDHIYEYSYDDVGPGDDTDRSSSSVHRKMIHSIPTPRDLNILFMGDSLSRFQYLDLAYFLTHNEWNDEHIITSNTNTSKSRSMVTDHKYDRWIDFFQHTNSELQPHEQCDCYRKTSGSIVNGEGIIENRYFRDEYKNNTVTYLQKFGDYPFKSSWNVSDIHNKHGKMITKESQLKPLFLVGWVDAIKTFVCEMDPKPSVFIFNQGWWTNNDLVEVKVQNEILDALRACDIISIYRTTNKGRDETDRNVEKYESQLCHAADYCMNLTWTAVVPKSHYVDRNHFQPPVYTWMNLELLSILASIDTLKM